MAYPKHPRKFEEGFKRQVARPYDNGKSPKETRDEYDICSSTPRRWVKATRENGSTKAKDNRMPDQERTVGPERENKRLRMVSCILMRPVKIVDKDLSDFSGSQWQLRLV